jgi:hypothetical protein
MSLQVVTGHDANSRAVKIDEVSKNRLGLPGATTEPKRLTFKTVVTVAEKFRK